MAARCGHGDARGGGEAAPRYLVITPTGEADPPASGMLQLLWRYLGVGQTLDPLTVLHTTGWIYFSLQLR